MLGLGAGARQPNAQAGARGQMPSQGSDIFNRLVPAQWYIITYLSIFTICHQGNLDIKIDSPE